MTCFKFCVNFGFNGFSNRHFEQTLKTLNTEIQHQTLQFDKRPKYQISRKSVEKRGIDSPFGVLVKNGGRDVINYVHELKLKRTPKDLQGILFGKFH